MKTMNTIEAAPRGWVDPVTSEKLKADLRVLVADMEQLLKATASQTGERIAQVRSQAEASLSMAKSRLAELQGEALARTRAAGQATDAYVHANPWQALALGALGGLLLGLLLGRSADAA
jgi:ElaB/YqjD/DUF883 family membrane-anchored ribosome-binding protein